MWRIMCCRESELLGIGNWGSGSVEFNFYTSHSRKAKMKTIYCISGLGADEKAFSKLRIKGFELKIIRWLLPQPGETLPHYAGRMRKDIKEENPILMGLSFGGMVCTEIAKQIPVKKIILISSIKSAKELPLWMKTVAALKLHKIIPLKSTKLTEPLQNSFLGVINEEDKAVAANYRRGVDPVYINWAVNQALNWKNNWLHPEIYQVHGDKDKIFPVKNIKSSYTIKNGGHFMIMNKADEVSNCINHILEND